ncbi:hypothetical protein XM25_05427 [Devosia sp. H5989]|nr:hypothetical protein XM25_05427 [Devosia sp. H5989]
MHGGIRACSQDGRQILDRAARLVRHPGAAGLEKDGMGLGELGNFGATDFGCRRTNQVHSPTHRFGSRGEFRFSRRQGLLARRLASQSPLAVLEGQRAILELRETTQARDGAHDERVRGALRHSYPRRGSASSDDPEIARRRIGRHGAFQTDGPARLSSGGERIGRIDRGCGLLGLFNGGRRLGRFNRSSRLARGRRLCRHLGHSGVHCRLSSLGRGLSGRCCIRGGGRSLRACRGRLGCFRIGVTVRNRCSSGRFGGGRFRRCGRSGACRCRGRFVSLGTRCVLPLVCGRSDLSQGQHHTCGSTGLRQHI